MVKRWKPPTTAKAGRLATEWARMLKSETIQRQSPTGKKILRAIFYAGASTTMRVVDDATAASNAKGKVIMESLMDELVAFGDEMARDAGN